MLGSLLPDVPEQVRSIERAFGLRDRIVLAVAILCCAESPEDWVLKAWWWTLSPGRRRLVLSFTDYGLSRRELGARRWPEPRPGMLHDCPCCGLPTLQARAAYEICGVCWWEDDGTDGSSPFSPNHGITLTEARASAARHLLMHGPEDARRFAAFGGADPALLALRIAVRDAADRCRGLPDGPDYDLACTALVDALEALHRRTAEHLERRHAAGSGG